jgi:hypothetical protein
LWGHQDINWILYYKFFKDAKLLPMDEKFEFIDVLYDLACSCGWVYTFENMVFVCEKPQICLDERGRLHKDGGMALKYSDGYGLYMLHGIACPEKLVMTKETELDPKEWINTADVDVRAQFVKKFGVERLKSYGKVVDSRDIAISEKKCHYELINMELVLNEPSLYLLMENPSVEGLFHMEGVKDCKTVGDALTFRKPSKMKAIPVNPNGEDWFQQGDVCIWPRNAKFLKEFPKVLT